MDWITATLLLVAATPSGAASNIDQVTSAPSSSIAPMQVDAFSLGEAEQPMFTARIGQRHGGTAMPEQLTGRGGPVRSPQAAAPAPPSAQGAAPLSLVAQGRRTDTERLVGRDRCDNPAAHESDDCRDVIETRAAEFAPAERSPLTPEQKLLVTEHLQPRSRAAEAVARRLGDGRFDLNAPADQGVAAAALDRGEASREETKALADQAAAHALAIEAQQPPK